MHHHDELDQIKPKQIISEDYQPEIQVKPRYEFPQYLMKKVFIKKWLWEMSIFKPYVKDTPELLEKCFEQDWKDSKITKIVKDPADLEQTKALLKSVYPKLKDAYRYYATIGRQGQIPCISSNAYSDFINQSGIVDYKLLKLSDVDLKVIAAKSIAPQDKEKIDKQYQYLNPERALVRCQFLEMVVRLAGAKFIDTKQMTSYSQAIQEILNNNMEALLNQFASTQIWRDNRYWNEMCDYKLRTYEDILLYIFKCYSESYKVSFIKKKFMTISEFKTFLNDASVFCDTFNERDSELGFY